MPELVWREDDPPALVASGAELDAILDRIDAEARHDRKAVLATLGLADGRSLTIGLGNHVAVLTSTGPNGMPPYLSSDSGGPDEPVVVFFYHGEWSEFPRWAAIAPDDARRAMRHFLQTGELLSEVTWREV